MTEGKRLESRSRDEALPRTADDFERLSVQDAAEVLERYPNLRAAVIGTVSGAHTEWPQIGTELRILLYAVHMHVEEVRTGIASERRYIAAGTLHRPDHGPLHVTLDTSAPIPAASELTIYVAEAPK